MKLEYCINDLAERFASAELYYGHGTDNADDEAFYLVFSGLGLDYADAEDLLVSRELSASEQARVEQLAGRRINERLPVAYLVGEAWFAGLPFTVNEHVLIPRSPLAELVAEEFAHLLPEPPTRLLDLCTGSGCIGIACAMAWPKAEVVLSDISEAALSLARQNIQRHDLAGRVSALHSDLFQSLEGRFDLIVSNPPYVSQQEIDELPPEYGHEPSLGLFSADEGLGIPLRILRDAPAFMSEGAVLIMEVGHSWQALAERLPEMPFLWLEFEQGGEGVLALDKAALQTGLERSGLISE